jgi:ABC-type uncharacterized transport system involved in gliding motility auxiliary subunit
MAMACEWTPTDPAAAAANKKTRLVVYGGSSFLTNQIVQQLGNQDLGLNAFNWATLQENKISIHPKEDDIRVVNLSNVGANVVFYLAVIIMPLAVLASGGILWYRRRSL